MDIIESMKRHMSLIEGDTCFSKITLLNLRHNTLSLISVIEKSTFHDRFENRHILWLKNELKELASGNKNYGAKKWGEKFQHSRKEILYVVQSMIANIQEHNKQSLSV